MSRVDSTDRFPIFTMPSGVAFLPSLAAGLTAQYGDRLSDALILLPTRRAVRALGDAFVELAQQEGRAASLLPRMRPLADISPDEPPFEIGDLATRVPPTIPPLQRRFDMAKIVMRYHAKISDVPPTPAGALAVADQLLLMLDDAAMEEVDLSAATELDDIAKFAAEHYQNAATLFEILRSHWPEYLSEQGYIEPMARRVAMLNALTEMWTEIPPDYPVIIAGSTGTLGATARLMRCVLRLPESQIILPGLDRSLRDDAWAEITEEHPQNALKNLLGVLGVTRENVRDFAPLIGVETSLNARRRVISEALVPVAETKDWPSRIATLREESPGYDPFTLAFKGLSIIEARNDDEEALTIALAMRHSLESEGATCALVTPDPALARRVKAALRRWSVNVDYSQGEPLEETMTGAYLAGLLRAVADPENPVHLAYIAKHDLSAMGFELGVFRRAWRRIEHKILRGRRRSLAALDNSRDMKDRFGRPVFDADDLAALDILMPFADAFARACDGEQTRRADFWARTLTELAETLARSEQMTGRERLWVGEAGETAANLLVNLMEHGARTDPMSVSEFADLFGNLMRGHVVRPRFGTHPRLQILGPLEARMLWADTVILGGLNEGIWPAAPSVAPFLSRTMRRDMGLSLPERRYGLSAHDFAELASNPRVILTRSERSDAGPMVASRWLWRLKTLARGAHLGPDGIDQSAMFFATDQDYLGWARALDHVAPDAVTPSDPPTPNPQQSARWPRGRTIAVTSLTTLIRDPYAHYAKLILGLKPLDALDTPIGNREFGNAVHDALERFAKRHGDVVDADTEASVTALLQDEFAKLGLTPAVLSSLAPRIATIAQKFTQWFSKDRQAGWHTAAIEVEGTLSIDGPLGGFTATARTDRIDYRSGEYAIIDYKSGYAPTVKEMKAGFAPQLPLQAAMLECGRFKDLTGTVAALDYVVLRGYNSNDPLQRRTVGKDAWSAQQFAEQAYGDFEQIIAFFDAPDAVYHSQPRVEFINNFGDYDHLARVAEWAKAGGDGHVGGRDG